MRIAGRWKENQGGDQQDAERGKAAGGLKPKRGERSEPAIKMELILFLALIGLIPAAIAHKKGYNFLAWWFYGAALFIVALPHALLIKGEPKELEERALATGDSKKCPFCAEIIKVEAAVCHYCGRDVPPALKKLPEDAGQPRTSGGKLVLAVLLFVITVVGVMLLLSGIALENGRPS